MVVISTNTQPTDAFQRPDDMFDGTEPAQMRVAFGIEDVETYWMPALDQNDVHAAYAYWCAREPGQEHARRHFLTTGQIKRLHRESMSRGLSIPELLINLRFDECQHLVGTITSQHGYDLKYHINHMGDSVN